MPLLSAQEAQSPSQETLQTEENTSGCRMKFEYERVVGPVTEYFYTIRCYKGPKPNALAISTAQGQAAVIDQQSIEENQGIAFKSYNSSTSTITLAISPDFGREIYLKIVVPTASTEDGSAFYYIAMGSLRDPATCQKSTAPLPEICSQDAILFPVTKPKTVVKCPNSAVNTDLPTPKVDALDVTADAITGTLTLPAGMKGNVQVCVGSKLLDGSVVTGGKFSVPTASNKLLAGQKILAQLKIAAGEGAGDSIGPASAAVIVSGASCSKAAGGGTAPTLTIKTNTSNTTATYSGKLPGRTSGNIRICVNDRPNSRTITVGPDGSFDGGTDSFTVKNGDVIVAQTVAGDPPTYGPLSNEYKVGPVQETNNPPGTTVTLIGGGWEQAGYSSLAQYGNPFVNVSIDGPGNHILTGWGRVRLLSAPQPSTQGIVSTIVNPTGQITTKSFAEAGQAMDFVIGPELRIPHSYWAVIAGFGATTPLSSQNVTLTYVAPPPGTVECSTLVSRFSAKNGYAPGLVAAPPGSATCLLGGYTDVAFANQDRSNFLLKYGGGFRTQYPFKCAGGTKAKPCSNAYGVLDLTFGQDEAVTGGILRSVVFKVDGMLPIPTGNASWLYVFGSAYMRLNRNENLSPLILQSATGVTVPSPTVIVLPLRQPNRDYYRLGVGINLSQIFCTLSASGCPNKNSGTEAESAAPAK